MLKKEDKFLKRIKLGSEEYIIRVSESNKLHDKDYAYTELIVKVEDYSNIELSGYEFGCVNMEKNVINVLIDYNVNELLVYIDEEFFINKNIDIFMESLINYLKKNSLKYSMKNIKFGVARKINTLEKHIYSVYIDVNAVDKDISTEIINYCEKINTFSFINIKDIEDFVNKSETLNLADINTIDTTNRRDPSMPFDIVTERVLVITSKKTSGMQMVVDKRLIDEDEITYVAKDKLFKLDDILDIKLIRTFKYTVCEFNRMFADKDSIILDVEKHLKDFENLGITYENVIVTIKYITNLVENLNSASKVRALSKKMRPIFKILNDIKINYLVYHDDYTRSKQCEHERSGHYRTYKSGKVIWINTYRAGIKS